MDDHGAEPPNSLWGPTDTAEPAPPAPRAPLWAKIAIPIAAFLILVMVAGFVIRVPYTTISPGDAVALTDRVQVDGAKTFPDPRGDIRLLFVRERNHVNLWRYLQAKLDDNTEILDDSAATGGLAPADLAANADADMADAKISATKVALEAAGYPVKGPTGFVVEATLPSHPNAAVLKPGDVIVSADGRPVADDGDLTRAVRKHKPGETISLGLVRDGKPTTVRLVLSADKGTPVIGVRVFPHYDFPVNVAVDTAGIGGPSAGLALTLAILDDLTPANLTGGKRVAVTGTIDPDGNVGEIGGIEQKGVAARAAGAQLFIVPQCSPADNKEQLQACQDDLARLQKRAGSKVKVLPVATFDDALEALRENGGARVVPVGPEAKVA
jgi:PDZ domain-containing protein